MKKKKKLVKKAAPPSVGEYTLFVRNYKDSLGDGEKFDNKVVARLWRERQGKPEPEMKLGATEITVSAQGAGVVLPPTSQAIATVSSEKTLEQPVKSSVPGLPMPTPEAQEMYEAVADAVHQTGANLCRVFTQERVSVQPEYIQRLNKCLVLLLRKYDKDGTVLEYSPEIAYVLTLADIATLVMADYQRQKEKEKATVEVSHGSD